MTAVGRGEPLAVATASGKPAPGGIGHPGPSGAAPVAGCHACPGPGRAAGARPPAYPGPPAGGGTGSGALPGRAGRRDRACRTRGDHATIRLRLWRVLCHRPSRPAANPAPQRGFLQPGGPETAAVLLPGRAAYGGGATTIGDVRRVLRLIPEDLAGSLRRQGWMIERNYHDHVGISWKQAFATDDPAGVERYCAENALHWRWLPGGRLCTTAVRSATLHHPATGEEAWFNHIAVFSEWITHCRSLFLSMVLNLQRNRRLRIARITMILTHLYPSLKQSIDVCRVDRRLGQCFYCRLFQENIGLAHPIFCQRNKGLYIDIISSESFFALLFNQYISISWAFKGCLSFKSATIV